MEISAQMVKDLRQETGLPVMECKTALVEAEGDKGKAKEILKKRGADLAKKRAGRSTAEGLIDSYIHFNNRVGVIIEVNCETDFVAKSEDFRTFVNNLCQQIAMNSPDVVAVENLPPEKVEKEKAIMAEQMQNVPEDKRDKAIEGKLRKSFYVAKCLLEQPFIWDEKVTIKQMLEQLMAKTGENVVVRRFARYQLGE